MKIILVLFLSMASYSIFAHDLPSEYVLYRVRLLDKHNEPGSIKYYKIAKPKSEDLGGTPIFYFSETQKNYLPKNSSENRGTEILHGNSLENIFNIITEGRFDDSVEAEDMFDNLNEMDSVINLCTEAGFAANSQNSEVDEGLYLKMLVVENTFELPFCQVRENENWQVSVADIPTKIVSMEVKYEHEDQLGFEIKLVDIHTK